MPQHIPETQHAVQLTGPDELMLNRNKAVTAPGVHQILCRVLASGLCFSDLKLLKQFSKHVRKTPVIAGLEPDVLKGIPGYVPDELATVPGHEAVVEVSAVGDCVEGFERGDRYLVQADWRWIKTKSANAAFGYNFEGALQEYVLLDTRTITSPDGESMLLPVRQNDLSAAAIALVEPWACVEQAYAVKERKTIKTGGRMLIVVEVGIDLQVLKRFLHRFGKPQAITIISEKTELSIAEVYVIRVGNISELPDEAFDDVIYFGSSADTLESLFPKLAGRGLLNIILCGGRIGRAVKCHIGRVHYGGLRVIGTTGVDPSESLSCIPSSGEIRPGNAIDVIGAGGPMGVMHVIRNICQGVKDVSIFAGDIDDERLNTLSKIAKPLADRNKIAYHTYNAANESPAEKFDYVILMAPVPALVAQSVQNCARGGIINIFAGIPAGVSGKIDLDSYIEKQLYFIGTSGSTVEDMKRVLHKVESGLLDTNLSVAAIGGLEGAIEGIRAVENRLISGKILIYPSCHGLALVALDRLEGDLAPVAKCLSNGAWNKKAEETLLSIYADRT
ncbi:MAG: alcohol dehydrogenase [Planctomycetota bacterium]